MLKNLANNRASLTLFLQEAFFKVRRHLIIKKLHEFGPWGNIDFWGFVNDRRSSRVQACDVEKYIVWLWYILCHVWYITTVIIVGIIIITIIINFHLEIVRHLNLNYNAFMYICTLFCFILFYFLFLVSLRNWLSCCVGGTINNIEINKQIQFILQNFLNNRTLMAWI